MNNSEHLKLRRDLANTSRIIGYKWSTYGSVYPPQDQYSTIFMTAQRQELEWIYGSRSYPQAKGTEAGTGWCVRSDAIQKAGKSNRHLCSFEMFGLSGIMSEGDAVNSILRFLVDGVGLDTTQVSANIPKGKDSALAPLMDYGIRVNFSDTPFQRQDTNRTGYRVEFNVEFEPRGEKLQRWEVQNLVILNRIGGMPVVEPIVDSGGSFERLAAVREGVDNVFHSSVFKADYLALEKNIGINKILKSGLTVECMIDLYRTGLIMAQSGFKTGTNTRREQTFRKVVREIGLKSISAEVSVEEICNTLKAMAGNIKSWGCYDHDFTFDPKLLNTSGLTEMLAKMYQNYDTIRTRLVQEVKPGSDWEVFGQKLSRIYDGGSDNGLVRIALDKLNRGI